MRKCCCCISVHVGAAILGLIGLLLCALELVVLIPYLVAADTDTFNPIEENLDEVFFIFEQMLQDNGFTEEQMNEVVAEVRSYLWTTMLACTVESAVYALCCLLMVVGSQCRVRSLMLPYLAIQILAIVLVLMLGVAMTVGLFFLNAIMGVVAGVVVFVAAFVLVYFWTAVQRAYVELGNRDYMYSPAPVKPIYNGGGGQPQHFQMEEQC